MVGGRYGKVKGFDFYIQDREKIRPFQRRILLEKSEMYIHEIRNKNNPRGKSTEQLIQEGSQLFELDPNHHDLELMEHWNEIYDEYGHLIEDFKDKWEREFFVGIKNFENKEDENKSVTPIKIDWMGKRKMKEMSTINKIKSMNLG